MSQEEEAGILVLDTLESDSQTDALSANQGKILNEKNDTLSGKIDALNTKVNNQSIVGDVVGNGILNTTTNRISFNTKRRGCSVGQSSGTTTNPWYKFASCTVDGAYNDRNILFSVYAGYSDRSSKMGLLMAHFRTNAQKIWETGELQWLIRTTDIVATDFVLVHSTTAPCTVELWCRCPVAYQGYHFDVIAEGARDNRSNYWNLYTQWSAGSQSDTTSGYTKVYSTVIKQFLNIGTRNTTDTLMPVIKSGELQYTARVFATGKTHTNYNIEQDRIPTLSFLSFWNGAYNSNNNSNLTYAHQGIIQCKPKTLYNNSSGTTGTVTLSETAANFNYLEVFYCDNNSKEHRSIKIANPNGKTITLDTIEPYEADKNMYIRTTSYTINNTSITVKAYIYMNFWKFSGSDNCGVNVERSNYIKIIKVIGYK